MVPMETADQNLMELITHYLYYTLCSHQGDEKIKTLSLPSNYTSISDVVA